MKAAVYLTAGVLPQGSLAHIERLRSEAPGIEWVNCEDKEDFLRELPDADIAATWVFKPEWGDVGKRLAFIFSPSAGKELVQPIPRPGLEVVHGNFHGEVMAETVLGLMLSFVRGIRNSFELQKTDPWPREKLVGALRPLRGSHAVILGFGHIGKWIARLLKPFGVRVTGVNRSDLTRPSCLDDGDRVVLMDSLDAVLPEADHLVLVRPGVPEVRHMLDARRLALLKPTAYVYNVGRGNAVDAAALADALKAGKLGGAGLDVFESEPLEADSPLRDAPNTILMPHISAFAPNYIDLFLTQMLGVLKKRFPDQA